MDWLTGGGGGSDGWEEDDYGDFSDQSQEEAEREADGFQENSGQDRTGPAPQEGQGHFGGGMALGGGMFMGRLTKFIDAVTHGSSDEEDQDGNGWNDEDDLDVDDVGVDSNEGEGWGEQDDDLADLHDESQPNTVVPEPKAAKPASSATSMFPAPQPIVTDPVVTQSQLVDSGWDDDLDLSGLETPNAQQQPDIILPLNDVDPPKQASDLEELNLGDEQIESKSPGVVDHTPPNRQVSSLSELAKSETAVAGSSTGWDDDLDGFGEEDDDKPATVSAPSRESGGGVVDITPPPPPPPPQAVGSQSRVLSGMMSFMGASLAAIGTGSDVEDGWDDEDAGVDELLDNQEEAPTTRPASILENTPPPPPPPVEGPKSTMSLAGQSTNAVGNGWADEDDLDLEQDDEALEGSEEALPATVSKKNEKLVDMTPLPPLPPRETHGAASASAVAVATTRPKDLDADEEDVEDEGLDGGWGEDDLDDLDDENLEANDDAATTTPLVDQTPPPPPPPAAVPRDTTTDAAVDDYDDISRDDTLSIANSRVRYEEPTSKPQVGPPMVDKIPTTLSTAIPFARSETMDAIKSGTSVGSSTVEEFRYSNIGGDTMSIPEHDQLQHDIVDQTPSIASRNRLDRLASAEESMAVLTGGTTSNTGSSIGDSVDSLSDLPSSRPRKVVDHTPPAARFSRGLPVDTSLAVAGNTSVGESLDSIEEEDDDDSEAAPEELATTPMAVEAGWGDRRRQPGEEYTIAISDGNNSTEIPFGSAISPTANDGPEGEALVPLVDHTPLPLVKNVSTTAASVDVLSVSSEEGDLGESIVGIDDVKEDLYGQVVDQTPPTPNPLEKRRLDSSGAVGNSKMEDETVVDTVVGVAENTDVEGDIQQDDDMDDESSRGTKTTLEEFENRSLISSVPLTIPEERQLVDHVPPSDQRKIRTTDASTVVFADAASDGSDVGDNVNDDDTSPAGFGPIVDHTPSVHFRSARSVATSVATQKSDLDLDMKDEEEMDNTVGPGGEEMDNTVGPGGEEGDAGVEGNGWDEEQVSLAPVSEEKHVVDHVPKGALSGVPVDASIRVMVDNMDDTTQVDTIAEDTAMNFGPIVDHTPFSARSVGDTAAASMATLQDKQEDEFDGTIGASIEPGDGWGNEIPDLEDISAGEDGNEDAPKEPTLVDHVPRRSFLRSADASTMVLVDPLDTVSEVGDDAGGGSVPIANGFGPVVDHTPAPPNSKTHASVAASMLTQTSEADADNRNDDDIDGGTWFGASTVGGVSTMGASAGPSTNDDDSSAGGWDDDGDILDDLVSPMAQSRAFSNAEGHLVDHVPAIGTLRTMDASTAVLADTSVVSSQNKDNDDTIDGGTFGAVVDQTPSVVARVAHPSVANSVATIATGLATDMKRDDEMDETTWNGGVSTQGDGWEQDEEDIEELADADDDQMPPLVDHVPDRPELRATDASTLVAGDPSEMFSQVDDLGQDETFFGPVVDQTPLTQGVATATVAGSTIVNIASVVEDDLDVAVENAIDGEGQNGEPEDQGGWQETLPNPQSGNEEEERNREQLVDYVPDEQEEEIPDLVRDGSSEMATLGEKSNLFSADDPQENEFGLIVDHTPVPEVQRVRAAMAAAAAPPVVQGSVQDAKKPASSPTSGVQHVDSLAPIFSVESKESKEDGLEEDEFGPVVDQLPHASSRASFTPSKGGSTVDALATVSEVDDDYIAGDGWEDDADIDVGDQTPPASVSRPVDDKNLSVKWIDRLNEKDSVAFLQKSANTSRISTATGATAYFDAEAGDASRLSLNETRYYDPETAESNGWGGLSEESKEDGDVTPPSTPRSSFEEKRQVDPDLGNLKPIPLQSDTVGDCNKCTDSSTADCPCVKSLLESNVGKGTMVGTLKTPEGDMIEVNFEHLLQSEMTKRRLVEKEFQALRTTIESLKASKESLVLAGETQMEILNKIREVNQNLGDDLRSAQAESNGLRSNNEELLSKGRILEDQIASLDKEKRSLEEETLTLKHDMDVLESKMAQVSSSAKSNLDARENEMQTEISKWTQRNEDLAHKISRFETECENLKGKNQSLYEDLESYRETQTKLEAEKAALKSNESALNVEIKHLKGSLQNQYATSNEAFQTQISTLQSEISLRSGECTDLQSQVQLLQKNLRLAEAANFKQAKEMAKIEVDHKSNISEWEDRLQRTKDGMEKALQAKDDTLEQYKSKLTQESESVQKLWEQNATLEKERQSEAIAGNRTIAEKERQYNLLQDELKISQSKGQVLVNEKEQLSAEIKVQMQRVYDLETKLGRIDSVSKERDGFREALSESTATIASMQRQIDEFQDRNSDVVAKHHLELGSQKKHEEELVAELSSANEKLQDLSRKVNITESKNVALQEEMSKLQSECMSLRSTSEQKASSLVEEEARASAFKNKVQSLQQQLASSNLENDALRSETEMTQKALSDLQDQVEFLQLQLKESQEGNSQLSVLDGELSNLRSILEQKEHTIASLREQENRSQASLLGLQSSHDELSVKIKSLEQEVSNSNQERDHFSEVKEEHSKNIEDLNVTLQEIVLQRDEYARAKDMLEEENEEMLVQFGMLKEQMDASDDHVERIEEELAQKVESESAALQRLKEAEERLETLVATMKGESQTALASMEAAKAELSKENHGLKVKFEELTSCNQRLQESIEIVESEKTTLSSRLEDLQGAMNELKASSETKETRLLSVVEDLERKCQDMTDMNHVQERSVAELQGKLSQSEAAAIDAVELRKRLDEVEKLLSESERLIQQKDGAIQDLQFQLEDAGRVPFESAEMETLRRTVQEMQESAEIDRSNIRRMELTAEDSSKELKSVVDQLAFSEKKVEQLRNEVGAHKEKARIAEDLRVRLLSSEQKLDQAQKDSVAFQNAETELRLKLSEMKSELEDSRRILQQPAKEPSGQSSAEIQSLREQIEALKQQQLNSSSATGAREEVIEREVDLLKRQMLQKDDELEQLEREIQSLGADLSHKHQELASKEEHVEKLSSQLADLRSRTSPHATSKVLELTRDEAESTDEMRSHIISLAKALEKSEGRRAEAIERLERERQANADSLRRLTESVKRFYSTLSLGNE